MSQPSARLKFRDTKRNRFARPSHLWEASSDSFSLVQSLELKMKKSFLALVFSSMPLFAFADTKDCLLSGQQLDAYLKLDYKSFDQTLPDGGWRGLEGKGCDLESVKLIEIYHLHHMDELNPSQAIILYWHAGQVYAMQDLTDLALARFKKSYNPSEKADDTFKWNSYVKGSIAFLEKDMKTLIKARDELRAVNQIESNPNLKFLESFIRCFKKSYREAYDPECK
jgi:hypothetical protein